jgi:hypothetical protein
MRALIRNIRFGRSTAVSTVLGVNWATPAPKVTRSGRVGGQIQRQRNLGKVDLVEHLAAGGQHLPISGVRARAGATEASGAGSCRRSGGQWRRSASYPAAWRLGQGTVHRLFSLSA